MKRDKLIIIRNFFLIISCSLVYFFSGRHFIGYRRVKLIVLLVFGNDRGAYGTHENKTEEYTKTFSKSKSRKVRQKVYHRKRMIHEDS